MQTFLPYSSYIKSARTLDNKRLGKQRVEGKQIFLAIMDSNYGWQNHPAVNMWRERPYSVLTYTWEMCAEWCRRGFKDSIAQWIYVNHWFEVNRNWRVYPSWLGNEAFHASHRSNLLRKDPEWYGQFGWTEPNNLEYVWPIKM